MAENSRTKAVERATNRSWEDWVAFLDASGARDLDHHEIAVKAFHELEGKIDNHAWWAQSVAVAYEQFIGRRIPGQRPDGTFQTSVSKSTSLGMTELMQQWESFAAEDADVQAIVPGEPKVSGTERRITWRAKAADGSSVIITSEPKKDGLTASIVATQLGLPSPEANQQAREQWASIIARFLTGL